MSNDLESTVRQAAESALDSVRDLSSVPNWKPLHDSIPAEHCGGFMWMYAKQIVLCGVGHVIVECYKHGITRRYLMIDGDRRFYRYEDGRYRVIGKESALRRAFDGLESMGHDKSVNYDGAFICKRNEGLRAAGYSVISVEDQGVNDGSR